MIVTQHILNLDPHITGELFAFNNDRSLYVSQHSREKTKVSHVYRAFRDLPVLPGSRRYWEKVRRFDNCCELLYQVDAYSDNLVYILFGLYEDTVSQYYFELKPQYTCENVVDYEGYLFYDVAVILERLPRVVALEGIPGEHHPFEHSEGEDQYFYRGDDCFYSFLGPKPDEMKPDESHWFWKQGGKNRPELYRRIEYFRSGKSNVYAELNSEKEVFVLDRYRFAKTFENYDAAKAFITDQQKAAKYGVEYMVAEKSRVKKL